ncbi:MAG: twin-arginine translocation signal domain-containing protein, partial [Deltaproteobacteria bacterium]|nr:twin-arginine translocation signal domain-containing protein [Deltaproteobacteria bacterium]
MAGVTRRDFIHATGALGITLTLGRLQLGCQEQEAAALPESFFAEVPAYNDWSDLYRQRFTWDSVHKST